MTYLECAAAGTYRGFTTPPDIPDDPVFEIEEVSWDDFTRFLRAGAFYE